MPTNVLDKIVDNTRKQLELRKQALPLAEIKTQLIVSSRSLEQALSTAKTDFILECKKASPSKGLIRETFDLTEILSTYSRYASAISVLTDQTYFQGSFDYLKQAAESVTVPVLCKDFFVDSYQVYEARYYGADAILLMLSVLDDETYCSLAKVADELNLDVLTEVHNEQELSRALQLNAKIIGINNRNLKDLTIDLSTTERLCALIPAEQIAISESGISGVDDIRKLKDHVNGFLIGSSLMSKTDLDLACRELCFGNNKVCGLTRVEDAFAAMNAGAIYGGLIFADKSKRKVDISQAKSITDNASLRFVGVFQDQSLDLIQAVLSEISLSAIQLHGDEDSHYIDSLRQLLSSLNKSRVEIWKVIAVADESADQISKITADCNADRILFDSRVGKNTGGTGQKFNWNKIAKVNRRSAILAGGLNVDNILSAKVLGFYALDINSGVEIIPSIKSADKLQHVFSMLRV